MSIKIHLTRLRPLSDRKYLDRDNFYFGILIKRNSIKALGFDNYSGRIQDAFNKNLVANTSKISHLINLALQILVLEILDLAS